MKNQKSDKILCSAGRGEVSKDTCLACALSRNQDCGFDYSMIKALFSDKEREGVHVTDLTGCLRKAYYDKTRPPVEYLHTQMSRFLGTAIHSVLEKIEDENLESEMSLEGYGIVGRADVVYKNGRIVDYKTTRWMTPSRLPYGSHVAQLNIYASLLRSKGIQVTSAAVQYIDVSGATKCRQCRVPVIPDENGYPKCPKCENHPQNAHLGVALYEIPLDSDDEIADMISIRRKELELSVETGEAPEAEVSYLCDYCPFQKECEA